MATPVARKRITLSLQRKAETISLLHKLMSGSYCSLDDPGTPPWFQDGTIHEISRSTYMYHVQSNYLKWSDGHQFMFAVDQHPFQFFWKNEERYFGRQLTEEETFRFCQLAEVKRYT